MSDVRDLNFGIFRVDLAAHRIVRGDDVLHVEPQVFELIELLCRNPGKLLNHDEIIEAVWGGRIVSDSAIASRINAARRALGDDGKRQEIIRTIRGRGFRLEVMPVDPPETLDEAIPSSSGEGFAMSITPHGYSLLMTSRGEETPIDLSATVSECLLEQAPKHGGQSVSRSTVAFSDGNAALECARDVIEALNAKSETVPRNQRMGVKVGIAYGVFDNGFAHAVAGRMDALADPGGICVSRRALDRIPRSDVTFAALDEAAAPDGSQPIRIMSIGDWRPNSMAKGLPAQIIGLDIPQADEVAVVVPPFEVLGGDEELQQVATGLRLEIQNALAQLSGVMPMAAGTAAAFSGAAPQKIAEALGLRYVVQGSVRAVGRQIRLMLELYDHRRGGVGWSQSYDGSLDEGFDFQDRMTAQVVKAMDVQILSGEQARIWHKSFSDLKTIKLQYRGQRDFFGMTPEGMRSAREAFTRVHGMHPDVSIGATWTSLCHWFEMQRGWCDDPLDAAAEAERWARIAIGMADADGQAHTALCHVHITRREFDEAERIGGEAVTVRPSCANANGFYAHALYYCGRLEKAIRHARLAIRYTPAYPPLFGMVLCGALHAKGDQEAAIAVAKECQRLKPDDPASGLILVSALWELGHRDQARMTMARLLRENSDFHSREFAGTLPFRDGSMAEQLAGNGAACMESMT